MARRRRRRHRASEHALVLRKWDIYEDGVVWPMSLCTTLGISCELPVDKPPQSRFNHSVSLRTPIARLDKCLHTCMSHLPARRCAVLAMHAKVGHVRYGMEAMRLVKQWQRRILHVLGGLKFAHPCQGRQDAADVYHAPTEPGHNFLPASGEHPDLPLDYGGLRP